MHIFEVEFQNSFKPYVLTEQKMSSRGSQTQKEDQGSPVAGKDVEHVADTGETSGANSEDPHTY